MVRVETKKRAPKRVLVIMYCCKVEEKRRGRERERSIFELVHLICFRANEHYFFLFVVSMTDNEVKVKNDCFHLVYM
jgi:hypothetical protein